MRVLVACECSGVVRDAFRKRGHLAVSCDLMPTERPGPHHQGRVEDILDAGWDLMIAHPPCTYLAVSGARWFADRRREQEKALAFVRQLMAAPVPRICIENPVSVISTKIRRPDQIIQPWQYGHNASKRTCLWFKNLPPLEPTEIIRKKRYANQTPSGQNRLGPSPTRARDRARTYEGIAQAMAAQWGVL